MASCGRGRTTIEPLDELRAGGERGLAWRTLGDDECCWRCASLGRAGEARTAREGPAGGGADPEGDGGSESERCRKGEEGPRMEVERRSLVGMGVRRRAASGTVAGRRRRSVSAGALGQQQQQADLTVRGVVPGG